MWIRACFLRFLSTPSARRATSTTSFSFHILSNFYPRPPRGGRPPAVGLVADMALFLSTPSARRATHIVGLPSKNRVISIHALREEGDTTFRTPQQSASRFLSTPSARRATLYNLDPRPGRMDFYPRPPRGGRLVLLAVRIQIVQFLSTPSARRATTALVWRRQ